MSLTASFPALAPPSAVLRSRLQLPAGSACPDAQRLQALCDALDPDLAEVVPIVWPCDDEFGIVLDYWDDQQAATASGLALARVLGKFMAWRDRLGTEETCLKHVNIVAHSMGNRVLESALASWAHGYGTVPALFAHLHGCRRCGERPVRLGASRDRNQRRRAQRGRLPCR